MNKKISSKSSSKKGKVGVIKGKEGVIVNDYQFDFEKIFQNKETRAVLRKYLALELNTEPLDFLESFEQLESVNFARDDISTHKEVATMVVHIVKTFIVEGSKKEINISSTNKSWVIDVMSQSGQFESSQSWLIPHVDPIELLRPIALIISAEIESDNFLRFIRSSIWIQFISTKNQTFLNSIGCLKLASLYSYSNEDFTDQIVKDQDFIFIQKLAMDSYDWEMEGYEVSGEGTIHGFWSTRNYLPKIPWMCHGGWTVKFAGVLPYPLELVAKTLLPGYNVPVFDHNVKKFHEFKYYRNDELRNGAFTSHVKSNHRSVAVVGFDCTFPFPMKTPRRCIVAASTQYFPEKKQIIMVMKPCELKENPLPPNTLLMKDYGSWILTRLDDGRTHFLQIHLVNLAGWAQNTTLIRMIVWERAKSLQKTFKKIFAKKNKYDPNDYLARLLEDCRIDFEKDSSHSIHNPSNSSQHIEDHSTKSSDSKEVQTQKPSSLPSSSTTTTTTTTTTEPTTTTTTTTTELTTTTTEPTELTEMTTTTHPQQFSKSDESKEENQGEGITSISIDSKF